ELHRVHQQAGDGEVPELRARRRPARLPHEDDGREEREAEAEAQREEGEGRRVLQADLRRDVARAPDRDEIPGEQRFHGGADSLIARLRIPPCARRSASARQATASGSPTASRAKALRWCARRTGSRIWSTTGPT